jgi:hypothetical protein
VWLSVFAGASLSVGGGGEGKVVLMRGSGARLVSVSYIHTIHQHIHDLYMRDHSPHSQCTWLSCSSLSGRALTFLFQGLFCFVAVSREWVSVFGASLHAHASQGCVWQVHLRVLFCFFVVAGACAALPGCCNCKCCTGSTKVASAALMPAC